MATFLFNILVIPINKGSPGVYAKFSVPTTCRYYMLLYFNISIAWGLMISYKQNADPLGLLR